MNRSIAHHADDHTVTNVTGHASQAVSCREARRPRHLWVAVIAAAAAWACLAPRQAEAAYSGSGTFNQITSASDITTGGYYVFAGGTTATGMGTVVSSYCLAVASVATATSIVDPAGAVVWRIDGNSTCWNIYSESMSRYIGHSAANNNVATAASTAAAHGWTFATTASRFTVRNVGSTARVLMYNSGSPRFACYSSAQTTIRLYKMVVPSIAIADNGTVSAANVTTGTVNQVLVKISAAVTTANATLNTFAFTTAGTYDADDLTNLKLWYSTDSTLDTGSDSNLSTISSPAAAGAKSFTGLSQTINSGSTGYFFITADVAGSATYGNTVSVNAIANGDLTFASGTRWRASPAAFTNRSLTDTRRSAAAFTSARSASSGPRSSSRVR